MNKHIVNSLKNYEFTYDKNNGYGFINGYEVNVFYNAMSVGPLFLFSTFLPQSKKNDFIIKMNSFKIPLVQAGSFDFGVTVMVGAMTAKTFEKKFITTLPKILEALESIDAPRKDVCPQSGIDIDDYNSKLVSLLGTKNKIRVSNEALNTINDNIEKVNDDYKNAPNNYLKGFCGIVIGAFLGFIVAVILGSLGFITSVAPLLSIVFGIFLYKRFKGKQSAVMIIMSFIVTIISVLCASSFVYILTANKLVAEVGLTYKGFEALFYCLEVSAEFKRFFIGDLVLSGFFTLLAEGICVYSLIKMVKRPKKME